MQRHCQAVHFGRAQPHHFDPSVPVLCVEQPSQCSRYNGATSVKHRQQILQTTNPSKREKQKTGKVPNVTDIMEQRQSNIDNKSFRTRKTENRKST